MSKIYCGSKNPPKGSKKGNMVLCTELGKYSQYGIDKVPMEVIKANENKNKAIKNKSKCMDKIQQLKDKMNSVKFQIESTPEDRPEYAKFKKQLVKHKEKYNKLVEEYRELKKIAHDADVKYLQLYDKYV